MATPIPGESRAVLIVLSAFNLDNLYRQAVMFPSDAIFLKITALSIKKLYYIGHLVPV
jgi:hypothetical protein